jgi:hypothetical protein
MVRTPRTQSKIVQISCKKLFSTIAVVRRK